MILPRSTSPQEFLATYWQKRPVLMPQALRDVKLPTLPPEELAWLATQADVESRLVFTERTTTNVRYRLEHGPFEEDYLAGLPERDWTILVQDVDKHLPDFRGWFAEVPFVPRWRIDDLMVSFAAPGGSVGPHRDNYDVFLCQGAGKRHWQISDDLSLAHDDDAKDLSLLKPFAATDTHECRQGDVLYLPPGIPHWGVAADKCTTYSIGLRAPARRELAACASRIFAWTESAISQEADTAADVFYDDADLKLDEICGAGISARSIERLYEQGLIDRALDPTDAAIVFGSQVTDPKAWLDPDKLSPDEAQLAAVADRPFNVHGMAQLSWYEDGETAMGFINGEARAANPACIALLRGLCGRGNVPTAEIREINQSPENAEFFRWLLERGAFDVQPDSE